MHTRAPLHRAMHGRNRCTMSLPSAPPANARPGRAACTQILTDKKYCFIRVCLPGVWQTPSNAAQNSTQTPPTPYPWPRPHITSPRKKCTSLFMNERWIVNRSVTRYERGCVSGRTALPGVRRRLPRPARAATPDQWL